MPKAGTTIEKQVSCSHCGTECTGDIRAADAVFCCQGCKIVFGLLNEKGLCDYYEYNEHPGLTIRPIENNSKFDYLNNDEITDKLILFKNNDQSHVRFYLPQMHCSSCLYLLEHLNKLNDGILNVRVDFVKREAFIVFDHNRLALSDLAGLLTSIGYEPHISLSGGDTEILKKADRKKIYKVGIAGFCFANIMMMSIPSYLAGGVEIERPIALFLRYGMLILSIPVVFYSGAEFFISAWKSARERYLNIDAPIALAIAITFIRSLYEIFLGSGEGYLDSLSGIIFFMLVGRLLQDQVYKSLSFDRDFRSFFPIAVRQITEEGVITKPIEKIETDDVLSIRQDEIIPVDSILSKGKALIDYSFVTGESLPVEAKIGDIVYAGGKQSGEKIEVVAIKTVSQSYLTNLWNNNKFKNKSETNSYIDLLSKHFTWILLVLVAITATYWILQGRPDIMWNAVTTMFIIACPCALLLTATYTYGRLIRMYGKNGLYLRHHDVLEAMSEVDYIIFDKTGTLTDHQCNLPEYSGITLTIEQKEVLCSLADESSHPLSRAISESFTGTDTIKIESYRNTPGKGIEGWHNDNHYKLGSASFVGYTGAEQSFTASVIYYSVNGSILGKFSVRNKYREGIEDMFSRLKDDYRLAILSGDHNGEKKYLDKLIGEGNSSYFACDPQQKYELVKSLQEDGHKVMMIGDGLNDAGALRQSNVGIAVSDSVNNFTPAADGILDGTKVTTIPALMKLSRIGRKIIYFTFGVSLIYNIVGLWFAVQGLLYPVVAAIIMPISSVTIIFLTYFLSGYMGSILKLKD